MTEFTNRVAMRCARSAIQKASTKITVESLPWAVSLSSDRGTGLADFTVYLARELVGASYNGLLLEIFRCLLSTHLDTSHGRIPKAVRRCQGAHDVRGR